MAKKQKAGASNSSKASARTSHKISNKAPKAGGFTRRGFMKGVGVAGGVAVAARTGAAATKPKVLPARKVPITLNVNGKDRKLSVEPRVTLLRALRNDLDLTGPKEVCDRGA